MATNFLFWNTNRKEITEIIAALAIERDVDVLILSECAVDAGKLLVALNSGEGAAYQLTMSLSEVAMVFTRFSSTWMKARVEDKRLSVREMRLPGALPVLLAITGFPSKLHFSEDSQVQECAVLADRIRRLEEREGHSRTVLLGDFNMNPFEKGMVGAVGLNATMDRVIAQGVERTVQGQNYPFFYNPMWNFFGDDRAVAGSYFYPQSEHIAYFWHIFDQVLFRPGVMQRCRQGDIEIVTRSKGLSLLDGNGRPDRRRASDHLPLFFRLNLEADDKE